MPPQQKEASFQVQGVCIETAGLRGYHMFIYFEVAKILTDFICDQQADFIL
jgi:hypothetical protein